jgi:hypothetical protein
MKSRFPDLSMPSNSQQFCGLPLLFACAASNGETNIHNHKSTTNYNNSVKNKATPDRCYCYELIWRER